MRAKERKARRTVLAARQIQSNQSELALRFSVPVLLRFPFQSAVSALKLDSTRSKYTSNMGLNGVQFNAAVVALTPLGQNEAAQLGLFDILVASWPGAISSPEESRSEFVRVQDALPQPTYVDYISLLSLRPHCLRACSLEACENWTDNIM